MAPWRQPIRRWQPRDPLRARRRGGGRVLRALLCSRTRFDRSRLRERSCAVGDFERDGGIARRRPRQRERRRRSGSGSGDCLRRATMIGESKAGSTTDGPIACTSNGPGRVRTVEDARGIRSRPERTSTTIIVIGIAITAQANALFANTPSDSSPNRPIACSKRISHVLGTRSSGATAATASATRDCRSNQRAAQSGRSVMCETFCVAARSPLSANAGATGVAAGGAREPAAAAHSTGLATATRWSRRWPSRSWPDEPARSSGVRPRPPSAARQRMTMVSVCRGAVR